MRRLRAVRTVMRTTRRAVDSSSHSTHNPQPVGSRWGSRWESRWEDVAAGRRHGSSPADLTNLLPLRTIGFPLRSDPTPRLATVAA